MELGKSILRFSAFWAVLAALVVFLLWHLAVGAKTVPLDAVWRALVVPEEGNFDHILVRQLRLPRALFAGSVGAALAVSGALLQGTTRNPLADPSLLGLMAGATFVVILCIGVLGWAGQAFVPLFAAVGAVFGAALVWSIATLAPGGAKPLTLILAGAAVTGFLGGIQAALILFHEEAFENFRIWLTGSLSGRKIETFYWSLPWFGMGTVLAAFVARPITSLAMGDEAAAALGVNPARVRILALLATTSLTAASVALAGPLGFIGLVIPHVARMIIGGDYRLIIPLSALLGASYVLAVDTIARVVLAPQEISTGLVTTLIGAPIFIWLVRVRL